MNLVKCKSILTKSKLPNVDYCYNIYIGCTHSCKYCYATFMRRFTGHNNDEWGSFVDIKENALDILKKEVRKIKKNSWVILGSVTDTYQPIEKHTVLTRKSLEVFLEYQIPVSVLTKSDLVLRDIDILKKFNKCEVGISCALSDDKIRSVLEPNSSNIDKRIAALKKLKQNGLKTYAFIGPIIPKLTDLEGVFKLIAGNVDFVMGEVLNLRCGNYDKMKRTISELVGEEETKIILAKCRKADFLIDTENKFKELCIKYNIENRGFFTHNSNTQKSIIK